MGSSSQQLYSLSWGEFGSSLTSAVQSLRGRGDLVDVTLAAGGRSFAAHKIVLSAASPFLMDLLKSTPCDHPVVMLAGVTGDELEALLEFVYSGEVSVAPARLPSLLQAAHCLSIYGLMPPPLLSQRGVDDPATSVPPNTSPISRETKRSDRVPRQPRNKRRKSSASSVGNWHRSDHDENDDHGHDETTADYDRTMDFEDVTHDDTASTRSPSELANHQSTSNWLSSQPSLMSSPEISQHNQPLVNPDSTPDVKPNLQTLHQYAPLLIPSFPGPVNEGFSTIIQNAIAAASTHSASMIGGTPFKVRGASDSPGVCPLCGATLRQARNLRRHLLSSCKYRLNNHGVNPSAGSENPSIEMKPEIEIPDYNVERINYGTDSGGSDSCERIICRPSLLPPYSPNPSNDGCPGMSPSAGGMSRSLDPGDCQGPVSTCSV